MNARAVPTWLRRTLLAAALTALVGGVWAGLVRLGWAMTMPPGAVVVAHGALMIHGLFGTLVSLERAVALERTWAYAAPLSGALGVALLVAGATGAAAIAFAISALVLVAASAAVIAKQRHAFTVLLGVGALALFVASLAFAAGAPAPAIVPSWMAFLIVTIAAERLELARMARPPRAAVRALVALLALTTLAAFAALAWPLATRALGAALVLVAAWLVRFDLARRTIRFAGLPRFVATALLAGYAWLALGALLIVAYGIAPGALVYDAALHAVFVGFVLSMVFAHAPIVLPAVARFRMPFHPAFYFPLAVLHASLALRVLGDVAERFELRRAGGLGHAFALVAFVVTVIGSHRRALTLEASHAASS